MRKLMISLVLLAGCATNSADAPVATSAAPVIAAERAFAAAAAADGWIPAFRAYAAPDAVLPKADIVSAPESLAATPDDGDKNLSWWPAFAGISRSGDLGFTTGPFSVDATRAPVGEYFTVWRKQPDGAWKWIFDGGPGPVADFAHVAPGATEVPTLPIAERGVGSAQAAAAQVTALEAGATNAQAMAAFLANDAHVYRRGQPRGVGGAGAMAAMIYPNAEVTYHLVKVEASIAGDLVFVLGEANWVRDGAPRRGYFGRIWQFKSEGWRVVYDQLIGRPAPPA